MTTKRKKSKAIERQGVNYVRNVVESGNCTFREIDLSNDIGNDAYIEFILGEEATGCCIGVQIKSGKSYISNDQKTYYLKADRDHFEYWKSHILPVAGIVFNPSGNRAVWCDIREYIENNSEIIEKGPYQVPISADNEFSKNTFHDFIKYFLRYQEKHKKGDNFGCSLEYFANVKDIQKCFEGIKSLFFYHRNREATWYYFVISFSNIENEFLRAQLAVCLAYVPGHGDIFWHKNNVINEGTRRYALSLIKEKFGRKEVELLLGLVDEENGFSRGAIGEWVHAIIDVVLNRNSILKSIAFAEHIDEKIRCDSLMLLIYYIQNDSPDKCIELISSYLKKFPNSTYANTLIVIIENIKKYGCLSFY